MDHLGELGMTRIVVAHRLSTVQRADSIVVLDRGKVVENASFDELMEDDGLFASLVRRQML
jgi:ABC-type multidrug transport system fused ATPase/permease subunit